METRIGALPSKGAIDRRGIDLSDAALHELLRVDPAEWIEAVQGQHEFFATFGDRLPAAIRAEHEGLAQRIRDVLPPEARSEGYTE